MNKLDFVLQLTEKLNFLPFDEVVERVDFYADLIDDRMEEGLSEEEAVREIGDLDGIVAQILADTSFSKLVKEKIKSKRRLNAGEIVLLVLGSPIWLSLGIAAFAVILSLYISLWAVIISLWSVFVSVAACSLGGILACVVFAAGGNGASGAAMLAAGIVCAGLSIFLFYGCKAATAGTLILTKKMALWTKNIFIKKEDA